LSASYSTIVFSSAMALLMNDRWRTLNLGMFDLP
jgi:hypothetical protein